MDVSGDDLKELREARGEDQKQFADFLNDRLSKKYDKARISRFECGAERLPAHLKDFVLTMTGKREFAVNKRIMVPQAPILEEGTLRPGKSFAIANQKGGVGKTASTVNLADVLAHSGYRVLVVDCDPQANATTHFGVDAAELDRANLFSIVQTGEMVPRHLYSVLVKGISMREIIIPVAEGRVDLAPSGQKMHFAEIDIINMAKREKILMKRLTEVRADYDFILIDCNPAIGQLTMNALIAANYLLIPCVMEPLPMMGIPLLLSRLETDVWDDQPDPKILGVLPTMFDARLTDHRTTLKEMREVLPNVRIFPPVPRTTSYSKASGAGVSLFSAMPEAPGMDSYREVAGAMIEAAFGKRARSGLGAEVTNVK